LAGKLGWVGVVGVGVALGVAQAAVAQQGAVDGGGPSTVTPPQLQSGQTTITVDPTLTPAQEQDLLASEQTIFQYVSKDTGLPIEKPVKAVFISREEVNRELRKKFDEDKGNKRMQRSELVLKKFGLLDQDFQLRPFLLSLLTEQIAGFYDNKTKQMTLLDWVPIDQQKPVMAHELTHALQDQKIGLTKWEDPEPEGIAKNVKEDNEHVATDEAGTAREAVLEGQAMVTFADYAHIDYRRLRDVSGDMSDSPVMARAPLILQRALLFPYTDGLGFEAAVLENGGKQRAFAGVLEAPPNTSAEIMQPKQYLSHTAEPLLRLPDLHPLLEKGGWTPYDVGVMGELDVQVTTELFGGVPLAQALAPEWDGGVYYAAQKKDASPADKATTKSVAILYLSRWKDADSARSFFEVFEQELPRQYDGLKRRAGDEKDDGERVYSTREGDVLLTLKDNTVWVSEGFDLAAARQLREMVNAANAGQGSGPVMQAEQGRGSRVEGQGIVGSLGEWVGSFGVVRPALALR
jgi:hypothetical protein